MRYVIGFVTVGLLVLPIVPFSMPAYAASPYGSTNDSMKVIVTTPNTDEVKDGETIDFTVHVFDKGEYLDINNENVTATVSSGYYYYGDNGENVELSKAGKGQFQGHFTVDVNTLSGSDSILVSATAEDGKNTDSDSSDCYIESDEESDQWSLDIYPDDYRSIIFPEAGDTIGCTLECYRNGELDDAPNLDIKVRGPDESEDPIIPEHTGTGKYHFTYTIPQKYENIGGEIYVEADLETDNFSGGYSLYWTIVQYHVWAHVTTMTSDSIGMDVYVADKEGKALEGVDVDLDLDADLSGDYTEESKHEVTDSEGKAHFYMDFPSTWSSLSITGRADKGDTKQYLSAYISNPHYTEEGAEEEKPEGYGFEVIEGEKSGADGLERGKTYTKKFRAYYTEGYDGTPEAFANKEVYYYIYTQKEIIKHGSVTTDSMGNFSITFTTPSDSDTYMLQMDFEAAVRPIEYSWVDDTNDGMVYDSDSRSYYFTSSFTTVPVPYDRDYTLSVDKLNVGGKTNIRVNMPSGSVKGGMLLSYMPVEVDSDMSLFELMPMFGLWGEPSEKWYCLTDDNTINAIGSIGNTDLDLVIPEYLPKNGKYTFFVLVADAEGKSINDPSDISKYWHAAILYVEPGKGASGNVGAGVEGNGENDVFETLLSNPMMLIGLIVILVVVIVAIVLVLAVRRKKAKSPKVPMGNMEWIPIEAGEGERANATQPYTAPYTPPTPRTEQPVATSPQSIQPQPQPKPSPPPPPSDPYSPTCPNCGHTATYISQYQRWYCYNCQRYL